MKNGPRRAAAGSPGSRRRATHSIVAISPAASSPSTRPKAGLLDEEDLASFRVGIEPPVRGEFGDVSVLTCGPWCQGPMLLQELALLDPASLARYGHNSPDYIHEIVEAIKLAAADREAYYGDPRFVDVPMAALLDAEYSRERRAMIDPRRAADGLPQPGRVAGAAWPKPWNLARGTWPAACRRAAAGAGGRNRTRYLVSLCRRPMGQRILGDTERWQRYGADRPRSWLCALAARLAVAAGTRPCLLGGARQAASADAEPGPGGEGWRMDHAVRHAGRRRADPGDAAMPDQFRRCLAWTRNTRSKRRGLRRSASRRLSPRSNTGRTWCSSKAA